MYYSTPSEFLKNRKACVERESKYETYFDLFNDKNIKIFRPNFPLKMNITLIGVNQEKSEFHYSISYFDTLKNHWVTTCYITNDDNPDWYTFVNNKGEVQIVNLNSIGYYICLEADDLKYDYENSKFKQFKPL